MVPVARKSHDPFHIWFAVVLADAQDAPAERAELLERIVTLDAGPDVTLPGTERIAALLQAQLAQSEDATLDVGLLNAEVARLRPSAMTNMWYFLSRILHRRDARASRECLARAANSPYPDLWTRSLAAHDLRAAGGQVERRQHEFIPLPETPNPSGAKILQRTVPVMTVRMTNAQTVVCSTYRRRIDLESTTAAARNPASGSLIATPKMAVVCCCPIQR
jgi:hypothetical protein